MIPFPTDLASARRAIAELKAVTDTFGPLTECKRANPKQTIYINRSGGESGAMLCHLDETGQVTWHLVAWFDSGDFDIFEDSATPQGQWRSSGNVNTGELRGQIARKAA